MATLDEYISWKGALEQALASGAKQVTHGDKSVTYRSITEIEAALTSVNNKILVLNKKKKTRCIKVCVNRGL